METPGKNETNGKNLSQKEIQQGIVQLFGQELPENGKGTVEVTEKERELYKKLKDLKTLFGDLGPEYEKLYAELKAKIRMAENSREWDAENGREWDAENSREWDAENGREWNAEDGREFEAGEIPQELKDFREKWKEEINLDENKKKAIIDAVNKIPHRATIEIDGSRLVEFELWWKNYKCLDVNLIEHSDKEYLRSDRYNWHPNKYNWQTNNEVTLWWMWWNDTKRRKNRALANYVDEQRNSRWMEIKTVEFQRDLINELWETAGLTEESDKIAMWMYLTWNYGCYWLSMWDSEKSGSQYSRSRLECNADGRNLGFYATYESASLCLIV